MIAVLRCRINALVGINKNEYLDWGCYMGWSAFRPAGLTGHIRKFSYKGYTLVSPLRGDSTYLLDMDGMIVHRWYHPDLTMGYARLISNGNLLLIANRADEEPVAQGRGGDPSLPLEKRMRALGGNASLAREVNWEGETIWQYENPAIHHDFVRLPNGNTLFPEWVEMEPELEQKVRGGQRSRVQNKPPMLGDDVIEVTPSGEITRRLTVSGLLDPRKDAICPLEHRIEWTHMNGLDVDEDGRILFSCRNNSRVGIIAADGSLEWQYGAPDVHHQHNATWLHNGNVMIFDNGMHRPGPPRSSIIEVKPDTNEVVWRYLANPEMQFFSSFISGAERQPNGNVLICEGASGQVFEVTPRGEVVWEWINPFSTQANGTLNVTIFRAHRYGPDHPAIAGRDLFPLASLNRLHGLGRRGPWRR